jgi:hypothetical protein
MRSKSQWTASAAVGGVLLLCVGGAVRAQDSPRQVGRVTALSAGSIGGTVQDEKGAAIAGAIVSAVGPTTSVAVTDRSGRFSLLTLAPGPYLLRARLDGFVGSRGALVEVRPSARASSSIALRRIVPPRSQSYPILAAGIGPESTESEAPTPPDTVGTAGTAVEDDHGEVAWRLRHARRSVLRDVTLPDAFADDSPPSDSNGLEHSGFLGRATLTSARLAANLFGGTPFSGQFHLLTTGSFETPQQLFSPDSFSRSVAYLSLVAPMGDHADWRVRGALTQGDLSSWIVAAAYTSRVPARHRYDLGASYSTQQHEEERSPTLRRDVTAANLAAGSMYGFDTFAIVPKVSVTYGARLARYDYLESRGLISPKVGITLMPAKSFRISAMASRRMLAPGAEEFLPPADSDIWLSPQRTFSSLIEGRALAPERTDHVELEIERDLPGATVSVRGFHQHVADQLVAMFGIDVPDVRAARYGHYFVASDGDVDASGWSAGVQTALARRIRGSVEYSMTSARWDPTDDLAYLVLFAPSALRIDSERVHDLTTTFETEVPETSTRVLVLYRLSNAFARPSARTDRAAFDSRFDVQVRQSLPFMDFSSARWEMLVAVRNFFREAALESSVYDELLVVRPPKRIVGGLTLRF